MRAESVVGLLGALVPAQGGQLGQPPAALGAAEAADRHREAVQDQDLRVEARPGEELLAELGLDRPQLRRLADQGRAMDAAKGREPVLVVAAEVLLPALVGVDAKELADTRDGQDLTVGQGRVGPRWRSRRPASHSSIRQYTVLRSVIASMLDPYAW